MPADDFGRPQGHRTFSQVSAARICPVQSWRHRWRTIALLRELRAFHRRAAEAIQEAAVVHTWLDTLGVPWVLSGGGGSFRRYDSRWTTRLHAATRQRQTDSFLSAQQLSPLGRCTRPHGGDERTEQKLSAL